MKIPKPETNQSCLLLLLIFCAVIPHAVLFLLELESTAASLSPFTVESCSNFFVCQWIPFALAFFSYLRLQKQDCFSWICIIGAGVTLLTYLPRFELRSVMTMLLILPLLLMMEATAFLKNAGSSPNPFLRGIAADRSILRAFFFWSAACLGVIFISCKACTWETTVVSPFQLLPFPGILLYDVMRCQKTHPPTLWSLLTMAALVPLSLFLATIGPMAQFQTYHLMCLGTGFAIVFLMLIVYNWDSWKQAER